MNYNKYFKGLNWWQILIVIVILFALLYGVFMLNAWVLSICWNAVIPALFSISPITVKQAAYLVLVVWTLGFGTQFKFNNNDNK